MNILITNHGYASSIMERGHPKVHGLISIGSRKEDLIPGGLGLMFSDITKDWQSHIAPTQEQVLQAIEYAKTIRGTLLVHCAAGQSRSVGIVLAILCSEGRTPDQALDALKEIVTATWRKGLRARPDDYNPNGRIIMHIDEICKYDGALIDVYCTNFTSLSLDDARSRFWDSVMKRETDDPDTLPFY